MRSWCVSRRTRSSHRPVGVVDDRTLDDRVRRIFAVVQSERSVGFDFAAWPARVPVGRAGSEGRPDRPADDEPRGGRARGE